MCLPFKPIHPQQFAKAPVAMVNWRSVSEDRAASDLLALRNPFNAKKYPLRRNWILLNENTQGQVYRGKKELDIRLSIGISQPCESQA